MIRVGSPYNPGYLCAAKIGLGWKIRSKSEFGRHPFNTPGVLPESSKRLKFEPLNYHKQMAEI